MRWRDVWIDLERDGFGRNGRSILVSRSIMEQSEKCAARIQNTDSASRPAHLIGQCAWNQQAHPISMIRWKSRAQLVRPRELVVDITSAPRGTWTLGTVSADSCIRTYGAMDVMDLSH